MNNSFNDLGISQPILKAIEDMGFETPTEVQSRAIPHILNKEDLIVMSKTGSGKTAVFGVSMLQLTDPDAPGPQGLILTPTRELAVQVDSDIRLLAKHLKHKTTAVFGQHSINIETQVLNKGVTIVTGTPGRVFDHIQHGNLITKNIRFLVLDEADRMLDMGFIDQVERIINKIPKDRVTLLFSATIPAEVRRICKEYMKHPITIEIESQTKTVDTIEQLYYRVERNEKRTWLNRVLLAERPESCMIFCNTRIAVDQVQNFLTKKGYASQALHGDIPQGKRLKTIQQFKQGEFRILVATDVAARGIHIEDLSLVINYDVPAEKDSYVHRIGRTGRAGKTGRAISLVTGEDIMSLYAIEEHVNVMIPEEELPSEDKYNEHNPETEKWIKDNTLKVMPRPADTNLREAHKGPAHSKRPPYEKRREYPSGPRTEHGPARKGAPQQNAASPTNRPAGQPAHRQASQPYNRQMGQTSNRQAGQPYNRPANRPYNRPADQTRPTAAASKPVQQSAGTNMSQAKAGTEKKSFLKRLFQRLLGK